MKFILAYILCSSFAWANLQVFPTKINLNQRRKVSTVTIRNRSNDTVKYKVQAVFYRQSYDGAMARISNPTDMERSIIKNLRFSPRRLTLKPGAEQVIRAMVRNTSKLKEGEYRAHLRFAPLPNDRSNANGRSNYVMMNVDAKIAINIPVIYTHGSPKGEIEIQNFKIDRDAKGKWYFTTEIKSSGNTFPRGSFKIYKITGKKLELITLVHGISSYLKLRRYNYPIAKKIYAGDYVIKLFPNETSKESLASQNYKVD